MSDDRNLLVLGPCFIHGGIFEFHPDTVVSVWIDPVTNRPPDVDEHGERVDPMSVEFAESNARAQKQPICPDCVKKINAQRAASGKSTVREINNRFS